MPAGPGKLYRIAIVGASSLLGKELKQVLEDRNFPASDTILLDESVVAGTLTEAAGEATFIRALEEDSFESAQFAFFAGSAADAERNWPIAQRSGATVIDLTGAAAASNPAAVCAIPSLESALQRKQSRVNGSGKSAVHSSASAPAIIACTVAAALKDFETRSASIVLFPPVSERGQAGIEELESQTASLLSFREIAQPVFDAQIAFNLVSRYGAGSTAKLQDLRSAIARDVARYLDGRAHLPAIQLVQTPVFYGYAFAAYAEFASAAGLDEIEAAFAALHVKVAGVDDPAPTNVSVAGESEIHLARIEADPNIPNGIWIWGAADNLRLAATNAVRVAEEIVAGPLQ